LRKRILVLSKVFQQRCLGAYEFTKGTISIGRSASADLCLDHPSISRDHVRIVRKGSRFLLEDLGSRNGTLLNGRRAFSELLEHGDVLRLGKYEVHVSFEEVRNVASWDPQPAPGLFACPTVRVRAPE